MATVIYLGYTKIAMTLQPIHAIEKCLVIQMYNYAAVNKILRKPDNKTATVNVKKLSF